MKKNLIFFLPNFNPGGAGNSILNICKHLNQKKYKIYVISLKKNFYKKELMKYCCEVKEIDQLKTFFSLFELENYFKNFDKSKTLIISNINYANALFVVFFKIIHKYKIAVIERTPYQELNIYYGIKDFFKKLIIKIIIKIFYKRVDALIANSKKTAKDFEKIIKKDCQFVYPLTIDKKINVKRRVNLKKSVKLLTIARLSKEKKLEDQINALAIIKNHKFSLNIVGDGLLKKKLQTLIDKLNVNIKIIPYSKKAKKKFLIESDLYICSSDFEGFPNTVVEAINYGLPVVSSENHGAIKEILLNGKGGDFYEAGNIKDLSNKICNVVSNYKKGLKKNRKAKDNLDRFSTSNIKKYEKIFDRSLTK